MAAKVATMLNRNARKAALLLGCSHTQRSTYVDVTMKWKRDPFFDTVDIVNRFKDLKALVALKNTVAANPSGAIPISDVSKCDRVLGISGRVAAFLRQHPAVFEEFTGPKYNLPWFRLTSEAIQLDRRERSVYEAHKPEIVGRLWRLVLMARENTLPLRVVQGMLWYLGLPEDFLSNPEELPAEFFEFVKMDDGERGLRALVDPGTTLLSVLQRSKVGRSGGPAAPPPKVISFPLYPSKGVRLKRKIEDWLVGFQRLPYVSPYEDFSTLDPNSDVAEKRVAGVLHELLCLFVDCSAERRKLLCLKKHLGLPQKFHKAFERHPHVFYLLLKSKTCFVVLKEAYYAGPASAIARHPMLAVRKEYVRLMKKSGDILRSRRNRKPAEKMLDERGGEGGNFPSEIMEGSVEPETDLERPFRARQANGSV